jgi:hypothetical protein
MTGKDNPLHVRFSEPAPPMGGLLGPMGTVDQTLPPARGWLFLIRATGARARGTRVRALFNIELFSRKMNGVRGLSEAPHLEQRPESRAFFSVRSCRAFPSPRSLRSLRPTHREATHGACQASILSAAMNASCGMSTLPNWRMRFLPSFCLSRSLRLRVMSPP